MEIMDMTFGGIKVGTLLGVCGLIYLAYVLKSIWDDIIERRRYTEEREAADKKFHEEHEWKGAPYGYGEWVRKDGRPIGDLAAWRAWQSNCC